MQESKRLGISLPPHTHASARKLVGCWALPSIEEMRGGSGSGGPAPDDGTEAPGRRACLLLAFGGLPCSMYELILGEKADQGWDVTNLGTRRGTGGGNQD